MVKDGATVVDVGMNRAPTARSSSATSIPPRPSAPAYMTPVPGGVGPMTIAMLLQNTVTAAKLRRVAGAVASPPETE